MPFKNESASKHGHAQITSNPDVKKFLEKCPDVDVPTKTDLETYIQKFQSIDDYNAALPKLLLAIDGSFYESFVDEEYPSRQVGYIKISSVLLNMEKYLDVGMTKSKYINPREIAKLQKEIDTISLALPGAYVRLPDCDTVTETFRKTLLDYLQGDTTKLHGRSLYDTLIVLIDYLGRISTNENGEKHIVLDKCSANNCKDNDEKNCEIFLDINTGIGVCPVCECKNYASDILRTFEEFSETESNVQAYGRIMSFLEHLLSVHYIYYLWKNDFQLLSQMCIFLDGPLAIFGPSAVFQRAIMLLNDDIRQEARQIGLDEPLIMGLSKSGRVYEHFLKVDKIKVFDEGEKKDFIPKNTFFIISDEYHYRFIDSSKKDKTKNHGQGTYYGQDIFMKTKKGRLFVFCLAYPFRKQDTDFQKKKIELKKYTKIAQALVVIQELEADLYENSVVPLVLAHKHTSISLRPGGKVLDILTADAFKKK